MLSHTQMTKCRSREGEWNWLGNMLHFCFLWFSGEIPAELLKFRFLLKMRKCRSRKGSGTLVFSVVPPGLEAQSYEVRKWALFTHWDWGTRSPSNWCPFSPPLLAEGSPTKIDCIKLILTSLLDGPGWTLELPGNGSYVTIHVAKSRGRVAKM